MVWALNSNPTCVISTELPMYTLSLESQVMLLISWSSPTQRLFSVSEVSHKHYRRRSPLTTADQGVGGITISTSKAALYTLGAGINPNRILPVVLDVGTDNHALFSDPLYMGWKRTRLRGKNYDQFIERFIRQCRELFPNAVIHFEDFGMTNAHRFMEKYKDIPMFNDDIQGTGAVALAALIAYAVIRRPYDES